VTGDGPDFRFLGEEDLPQIHGIWAEAGLPFHPEGRDSLEAMTRELHETRNFLLGAFEGGALVGVALGTDEGRKGWINRLAVKPTHRRRGLALALVHRCEEEFSRRGMGLVCALVEDYNGPSMALMGDSGFVRRDDIHYFRKEIRGGSW
jgi:GNAT superfamily N-acetyltransferase